MEDDDFGGEGRGIGAGSAIIEALDTGTIGAGTSS